MRFKRPISVTILAWVYIAMGVVGFVYHLRGFTFQPDNVLVEFVRILAIVGGAFMLGGYDWARWLAIGWIGFHVILSAFHSVPEFAVHCLFLAVISIFLLRPDAVQYFRGRRAEKE